MNTLLCKKCDTIKPTSEFVARKDRPGKFRSRCKDCENTIAAERRAAKYPVSHTLCKGCNEVKPFEDFNTNSNKKNGISGKCKDCEDKDKLARQVALEEKKQSFDESLAPSHKLCSGCDKTKAKSEFYRDWNSPDYLSSRCKRCNGEDKRKQYWLNPEKHREKSKAWSKENPEYRKEYNSLYYCENREDILEYMREYSKKFYQTDHYKEYSRSYKSVRKAFTQNAPTGYLPSNYKKILYLVYGEYCPVPNCEERYSHLIEIDHVTPVSLQGPECISNFQPLCKSHNSSKSNRSNDDYRDYSFNEDTWHLIVENYRQCQVSMEVFSI